MHLEVTKLCDLGPEDSVTSVSWTQRGTPGGGDERGRSANLGCGQVSDHAHDERARARRHALLVATRSRAAPRSIDPSAGRPRRRAFTSKLTGHKQEVCGLKWSFDGQHLASGGNDNKLYVWTPHTTQPLLKFHEHTAAVKAISWSPHQNGLLASGGGTADRCMLLEHADGVAAQLRRHRLSGLQSVLVQEHQRAGQHARVLAESDRRLALLVHVESGDAHGHTLRVLYLAMSPDGQTIVTGAGDETLRFWNVFPGPKSKGDASDSSSMLDFQGRTAIR